VSAWLRRALDWFLRQVASPVLDLTWQIVQSQARSAVDTLAPHATQIVASLEDEPALTGDQKYSLAFDRLGRIASSLGLVVGAYLLDYLIQLALMRIRAHGLPR
jgi:hypothetical protein